MWVQALARHEPVATSDAGVAGGKALGLARLIAAGLPVPEGFVIEEGAFRSIVGSLALLDTVGHQLEVAATRIAACELPVELVRDVEARAVLLGRLAVRSSATLEDREESPGAGVFASIVDVPAADVWGAIRAVWTSALTPLAASYARGRGELAIGVIVQRFVPGERVTVYTRPPGSPTGDELWIQRGAQIEKRSRQAPGGLGELALRAERAIEAARGADVELVVGDLTWVVQARPIAHPVAATRTPPPPAVIAPLVADGRVWTWDIAHNPDPLSPAQTGLVERVERAAFAPWSLRVCAGYLYTTPLAAPTPAPVTTRAELEHRAGAIEARLARVLPAEDAGALPIEQAIARFLEAYRIWACELVPLIGLARRGLSPELLRGARPSAVELTLLAAARGELAFDEVLARIGVLAPAWDLAVPTFAETPALIRDAIARAGAVCIPARPEEPGDRAPEHALARAAADLAERDDVWFARAQWTVRRAILARASELALDPEDACWLPLDELAASPIEPGDARRRASAARCAADRTRSWTMPHVVGGPPVTPGPALVGFGGAGQVTGRVVRLATLAATVSVGHADVIVTRAITPAIAVTVIGCAGIVSETGGPLDHGAALARELGIPCIVGCRDAWSLLSDGMIVCLDGDEVRVLTR